MNDNVIITNRNRDNAKLWFEHYDNNLYTIHSDIDWVLDYARVIGNKEAIEAFDPSGGPFISIRDKFENKELKRIFIDDNIFFELINID